MDTVTQRAGVRRLRGVALAGAVMALTASFLPMASAARHHSAGNKAAAPGAVRVVVVGDIACDPADPQFRGGRGTATACGQRAVGRLVERLRPDAVVTTGDNQYDVGALRAYRASYAPAMGSLRARTWPVPGNHDYGTAGAAGYFAYFGARAGSPNRPWRSFSPAPGWRVLLLDSNCWAVGGCGSGSRQHRWIKHTLAHRPAPCTIAAWHHPLLTAGEYRGSADVRAAALPLWRATTRGGVDVVLNGHDHNYQRWSPRQGVREFVVGTGGRSHYRVTPVPRLAAHDDRHFGALVLTLRADRTYRYAFWTVHHRRLDAGRGRCANSPG